MKWYTHATVGANAVWLVALAGRVDEYTALLAVAGAFAALLPDIDAATAKIHYLGGGVLGIFKGNHGGIFQHRGLWHSLFMTALIFIASLIWLRHIHPALPYIITLGYFSHPVIDALNSSVGFLFPFYTKRINLLPKILLTRVGGPIDTILFIISAAGLFIFLLGNIGTFLPLDNI